ncbi:MAG: YbfB/YjiJ family MFS transporter [Steroidobacteraceae bacterium]
MPAMSVIDSTQSSSPLRAAVGGLIALAVAIGIGRFIYTPILPSMMAALGLPKLAAGLIASANFAGYLTGALLVAGARLSARGWILGGLIASALTTSAMALAHSVMQFVILRATGGLASAVVLVLACATVLDALGASDRSDLATLMFAGVGVGIAGSAALLSAVRAAGLGWPALWVAGGALSMLGACACWRLIPDRKPLAPSPEAGAARFDRRFIRLSIAYGLFGFAYIITATFLVAIVRANPGTRQIEAAVWVAFGLAAIPSVALWSAIGQRLGATRGFALAALTEALGVVGTITWQSSAGVFAATVLVGGTFMGLTGLGLSRGRELAAKNPQRGLALMTSAFGIGQIVGPSFAGALSDRLGSFTLVSVAAAAALVICAALAAI